MAVSLKSAETPYTSELKDVGTKGDLHTYRVLSTDSKGHVRRVSVAGTDGRTVQVKVHRYAAIGKGDELVIDPSHRHRLAVVPTQQHRVGADVIAVHVQDRAGVLDIQAAAEIEVAAHVQRAAAVHGDAAGHVR